jgi:hypothetical protein
MELRLGKGVNGFGPMHLTQRWWYDIVTNPSLLDAVEDLMGPNVLVWSSQFWCKEPGSTSFVGWHQVKQDLILHKRIFMMMTII